ncbi:MAG TPA: hypothetical protein VIC82_04190 [Candidatus Nanopelagicales bacterium]|jgi:hypothetical protein
MIVRILGEGQFELASDVMDAINELDAALETALAGTDEASFRAALDALLAKVRSAGIVVPDDSLEPSEVVLPFADASSDDVRELLTDEGLIPG